jgi:hypothetical protein
MEMQEAGWSSTSFFPTAVFFGALVVAAFALTTQDE